jgi:glycosyltransferase involved in cell wall biosynthesis
VTSQLSPQFPTAQPPADVIVVPAIAFDQTVDQFEQSVPVPRDRPRVSILVGDLSKSGAGRWGGAVRPFLLAQTLQKLGCSVKIFGFCFGEQGAIASTPELPITAIQGDRYPQFFRAMRSLSQQIDGDILYAYKPKPTSFGMGLLQRWKTRKPLILDVDDWEMSWHGGDEWRYRPSLKQLARDLIKPDGALRQPDHPVYLQRAEKWANRADAITVHTQFLQQRFGGIYVPNGKDVERFNPVKYDAIALKAKYGLSNYRVLIFPGAPRPYKGVEDVLTALDLVNQPDLRLVIVGGSPYDDYDQSLMERWGRWIIKLPTVANDQMPEIIAAADVVVVPQRDTPAAQAQFPLKLTDGMAMAKPILATRIGDIPNIVGDAGYLVDASAPQQLADQIQQLFGDWQVAIAKGEQARQRCVEHYSIDAMAKALAPVIEQLSNK